MKDTRIVLPLVQTVFLPQNAMGVRYIDRVRTKVYVDNLSRPAQGPACLQGFYELDLEYHGLEGQRLYKHRVMLPLRAELPADWPPGVADFEAADLHCVITKPMLRILSPYVLEFGAGLAVEYVGDRACAKEEPTRADAQIETDINDELQEEARRLESKFGWGLAGQPRREIRTTAEAEERSLPVWRPEESSREDIKESAQPVAAEAEEHSLPVWRPEQPSREDIKESAQPVAAEAEEHSLPVWRPEAQAREVNSEANGELNSEANSEAGDKAVSRVSQRFVPAAESKSEPNMNRFRSMLTTAAISRLEARGESLTAAANADAVKVNEQVREQIGEAIKEQVNVDLKNGVITNLDDYKELDTVGREDREQVKKTTAETVKTVESGEITAETVAAERESGEKVEETVALAAENDDFVEEAAAPVESSDEVVAAAAVVESGKEIKEIKEIKEAAASIAESGEDTREVAALTEESGETTAEAAALVEESGETAAEVAANDNKDDERIAAVNSAGVRLRMGVHNGGNQTGEQAARSSKPVGGFSLKYYVVKPGDDPMSIALKHNVSLEKLQAANRRLESELAVGTVLKIPV